MNDDKWVIEFQNDWKQIIGKWNWYTFTVIELYFENDKWTHGYEAMFVLLGLGVRIRYNTDKALEQFAEWDKEATKRLKDINSL